VQAFAAGNVHDFDIKFITPLRCKHAGGERQLSLLIVRPIAYRLRKGAHLSYRKPAYLISSDPTLAPQQILQAYLWRWEIELNFRDEKTLLGFRQPQVRGDPAVRTTATTKRVARRANHDAACRVQPGGVDDCPVYVGARVCI
jgi:hypothetical protein